MTKVCSKCGIEKSLTEFCKRTACKSGLKGQCKICDKEYRDAHKADSRAWRQSHAKDEADRAKRWQQNHIEELVTYRKEYRHNNKKQITIQKKQYSQTVAGKATNKRGHQRYTQTIAGKAAHVKGSQRRRALEANVFREDFNPIDILKRDDYRCQMCGKKTRPDFKDPHHSLYPNVDHIVPLSKGGSHTKQNTQCLCHKCNTQKNNSGTGDQLRMFG